MRFLLLNIQRNYKKHLLAPLLVHIDYKNNTEEFSHEKDEDRLQETMFGL